MVVFSYFRIPLVSMPGGQRFARILIPISATTRQSQENAELTVGEPVDCNSSTMYAICGVNIFSLQIECKQNSYRPSSSQQLRETLTQIAMWYNVHKATHSCRPVCQRDDSIEHGKTHSGRFSQVANKNGSGETREDRIDTAEEKKKKSVIARRHDDNVEMSIMFSTPNSIQQNNEVVRTYATTTTKLVNRWFHKMIEICDPYIRYWMLGYDGTDGAAKIKRWNIRKTSYNNRNIV